MTATSDTNTNNDNQNQTASVVVDDDEKKVVAQDDHNHEYAIEQSTEKHQEEIGSASADEKSVKDQYRSANNDTTTPADKDQNRKDAKATTTTTEVTSVVAAATNTATPINKGGGSSNISSDATAHQTNSHFTELVRDPTTSLDVRVGAWRIQNPLHNGDDNDSSIDDPMEEEEEEANNSVDDTIPGDEEGGNGPLIQAQLVTDETNQKDVMTLDAEILKDTDTPERKRRRQMIRFLSVIVMIIIIVVIVTVIVVNNVSSGSSEPTTAFPTLSPLTPLPTEFPTFPPTEAPSDTPSQAPTQLIWSLAMGGTTGMRLNAPQDESVLQMSNGKVASRVFVKDVSNVTEFQNAQLLLALQYGGYLTVNFGGGGLAAEARDVSFYLCGNTTEEEHDGEEPFCHPAWTVTVGAEYRGMAMSENGALLVMDNGPLGISLHDLRMATSLEGQGTVQAYLEVGFGSVQSVGIAPTKGYIVAVMQEGDLFRYELEGWEEPGQARIDRASARMIFDVGPPCIPDAPCLSPLPKKVYHMVMSDASMAIGINVGLRETITCLSRCFNGLFNGIEIHVYDLENTFQVGNIIEMGTNYSMISQQGPGSEPGGLAMTADGKTVAVGSAYFPRYDQDDGSQSVPYYQVDVYRLNEENNMWEPLGSTLYGSKTNVQDNFGGSLAFNSDGTVLVVGASLDSSVGVGNGRVSTYELVSLEGENGTLVEEWMPYLGDLTGAPGSHFGRSLDILPSGDHLLVGAPLSNFNGEATGEAFLYNLAGIS
mmetsp:Transcript_9484/g.20427  ORF Transcript_9484/g.20427 Transcript_9484/m.20427 type:complete len:765 (-) Transcript_9484:131-2425(-)|eukprot:CAMPEP_0168726512 /NCGR_PEP_ID=MMETSP0724-20121128/4705_1 /TAXON_ID=265536 /ORGANISM="Amphiprora sp., Strain CCMP467" /LENGTH=764 /DNA_ID=CAMNT_0008773325 /DNA_START=95 /DNA_END=2389 /DNA_ORIENTATION=-